MVIVFGVIEVVIAVTLQGFDSCVNLFVVCVADFTL